MADLTGQRLGPYLLQRKLGQGGMGAVYVGVHQTLNVPRAIKVLLPTEVDEAVVERFVREGVISASLRHPNIVEIFDVGEQDDIHFLVMEEVEGDSLMYILRRGGAIPIARTVALLRQMAAALDYAHSRGIVHRDIKPSNIIIGPDDHVTLIDFGIARAMDESRLTRVGVVVGTFEYMAPEVVTEGGGSPGADRYALGIVAYQMLTGRVPFTGESAHSIMYRQVHDTPPPPTRFRPDLPEQAEAALLRQLSKEPDARFPSAQAFVDALAAAVAPQPADTEATSIADITRPGFERPTPGSGQTPLPRSGRATRPATAATLTPPPGARPQPTPPPPPLSYPGTVAAPVFAPTAAGTVQGAPVAPTRRSSAGLIIGITALIGALVVVVLLVSPLRETLTELVAGAPVATATSVPQAKPVVTPAITPAVTAVAAVASTGPTTAPIAQPKPALTPVATAAPATATAAAPPTPSVPPTPAAPPTLTAEQRLAQAREASKAGNHPSALALLNQLRSANPALPGLDDAQYDVHMAFAQ
ncbi:MAG: protein kinase, partial [Chloroflexota bacterium]